MVMAIIFLGFYFNEGQEQFIRNETSKYQKSLQVFLVVKENHNTELH